MDELTLIRFAVGFVLLILGADLLVRGASRLAAAVGLSPLVIGLTVVAFGTSAPELAVSVQSSFSGQSDLALGNIVGSNIFNVLLILGLTATIAPLVVSRQLVRLDVPIMIGSTVLLLLLALDGSIGRLDGVFLVIGVVVYTVFMIRQSKREPPRTPDADAVPPEPATMGGGMIAVQVGLVIGGVGLLVLGSRWLVAGAVAVAELIGVDELVIGLTIVAAGTSLPEVATSVLATIRGERDIAVGNVVGSCIYNILVVLGLAAVINPSGIPVPPSLVAFDLPVAVAVAVACLPIFVTGRLIARWEGLLFLGYYLVYMLYLILSATQHHALTAFSWVMAAFVLPLTGITIAVLLIRAWRQRRPGSPAI